MRLLFTLGEWRMVDIPCSISPLFSILLSINDAYERVIPRAIPIPSWVISNGAPYEVLLSTYLNPKRWIIILPRRVILSMNVFCVVSLIKMDRQISICRVKMIRFAIRMNHAVIPMVHDKTPRLQ